MLLVNAGEWSPEIVPNGSYWFTDCCFMISGGSTGHHVQVQFHVLITRLVRGKIYRKALLQPPTTMAFLQILPSTISGKPGFATKKRDMLLDASG